MAAAQHGPLGAAGAACGETCAECGASKKTTLEHRMYKLKADALEGRVQKLNERELVSKQRIASLEQQLRVARAEAEQLPQLQQELDSCKQRGARTAAAVSALEQRVTALLGEYKTAQAAAQKWHDATRAVAGSPMERWAAEAAARQELLREVLERDGDRLRKEAAATLARDMLADPSARARAEEKAVQALCDDPIIYKRALDTHEMDAKIAELKHAIKLTEQAAAAELRAQDLAVKVENLQAQLDSAQARTTPSPSPRALAARTCLPHSPRRYRDASTQPDPETCAPPPQHSEQRDKAPADAGATVVVRCGSKGAVRRRVAAQCMDFGKVNRWEGISNRRMCVYFADAGCAHAFIRSALGMELNAVLYDTSVHSTTAPPQPLCSQHSAAPQPPKAKMRREPQSAFYSRRRGRGSFH